MDYSVLYTPDFEKQLKKLSKKYPSIGSDLAVLSQTLAKEPFHGVALGNGCYKIRMAITSKAQGKSGGARIITCVVVRESEIYLAAIYDKSKKETIDDKELKRIVSLVFGD